jgi:hypothetical protein
VDHCQECDYTYDLSTARAAAQAIRGQVADIATVLRGPGELGKRLVPEVWAPVEYACHVRDVLLVQRERALSALRNDKPACPPMGRDERVEHDGYATQVPEDVARQITDAAQMFTNVLDRLGDSDWSRSLVYNYPEPTERSLEWLAVHTLHEVQHHLRDIRGQLA